MMSCARFIILALAAAVGFAQIREPQSRLYRIRVDSDLVLVQVLVTDSKGSVVTGLQQSNFQIFEDGVRQDLRSCAIEDAPVSVVIALDTSSSVSFSLPLAKKIVEKLIQDGSARDEYALIQFQDRPQLIVPFTRSTERLVAALDKV